MPLAIEAMAYEIIDRSIIFICLWLQRYHQFRVGEGVEFMIKITGTLVNIGKKHREANCFYERHSGAELPQAVAPSSTVPLRSRESKVHGPPSTVHAHEL